ncbi:MAG: Fic/DOC family N-terminal domain-containing protein [Candidatus Izemoplasmatales bacterium]|nr:Fic/DOC family N-terminal domain-containing protein [Candidatus Izemoplasmatales bacterium]
MTKLPFQVDLDQIDILKALNIANNRIGELNGVLRLLPNPQIILNAITLGEAKESSEIENIVTTFDEIFREITLIEVTTSAKEVVNYRTAMLHGLKLVKDNGFISTNILAEIHRIVDSKSGDIRKIPGTVILNTKTKAVLHTPPQSEEEIRDLLANLENYINNPEMENTDSLIKMALIHYQFESIHPFHDGNGRTGRILNILYLVQSKKLSLPILYLSKYINQTKAEYYSHLQTMRMNPTGIQQYVIYMLNGVSAMCDFTIGFIEKMTKQMDLAEKQIRTKCPKIYSHDLILYLFRDFYTKNEFFRGALGISRNTASAHLKELEKNGFLIEEKVGKETLYKNAFLYELMQEW